MTILKKNVVRGVVSVLITEELGAELLRRGRFPPFPVDAANIIAAIDHHLFGFRNLDGNLGLGQFGQLVRSDYLVGQGRLQFVGAGRRRRVCAP